MPAPPLTDPRTRQRRRAIEAQGAAGVQPSSLPLHLTGQDTVYGAPGQVPEYDWQMALPVPPRRRARALLTHLDDPRHTLALLGQDTIYGAPGQAPTREWSEAVPKGHRYGPRFSVSLRTHLVVPTITTLLGQDQIYSGPGQVPVYAWPLPTALARPRDLGRRRYDAAPATLAFLLTAPVELQPDGRAEFPQPPALTRLRGLTARLVALRAQREVAPDLLLGTLAGQDQMYAGPGQVPTQVWPPLVYPPEPGRWRYGASGSLLTFLLEEPVEALPAGRSELPGYLRRAASRLVALRAQAGGDLLLGPLVGQDRVYAGPGQVPVYAWVVPPGRAPHRANRTHTLTLIATTLLGQDQFYGAPGQSPTQAWPLPTRDAPPRSMGLALQPSPALLAGAEIEALLLRRLLWPLPNRPVRRGQMAQASMALTLLAQASTMPVGQIWIDRLRRVARLARPWMAQADINRVAILFDAAIPSPDVLGPTQAALNANRRNTIFITGAWPTQAAPSGSPTDAEVP